MFFGRWVRAKKKESAESMEENKWICALSTFFLTCVLLGIGFILKDICIPHGKTINEIVYHEQFREWDEVDLLLHFPLGYHQWEIQKVKNKASSSQSLSCNGIPNTQYLYWWRHRLNCNAPWTTAINKIKYVNSMHLTSVCIIT